MTAWPIIIRELRTEARRPLNYWLRASIAGLVSLIFCVLLWDQREPREVLGGRLFSWLNTALFSAIWILVPLLTADCISKEKREGTLPLLFLTPLRPLGIVVGKSLIHTLRSANLFLAVIPILALPFLLGGVNYKDALLALLLNIGSLWLALAAGLAASTLAKDLTRALVLSQVLGLMFLLIFMTVHFFIVLWLDTHVGLRSVTPPGWSRIQMDPWDRSISSFLGMPFSAKLVTLLRLNCSSHFIALPSFNYWGWDNFCNWAHAWANQPLTFQTQWLIRAVMLMMGSFFALAGVTLLAALHVSRIWRDQAVARTQNWLLQIFCTPRFWRSVFRSRMTKTLNRNPIGWLQQYRWAARLSKWGWCLLVVLMECVLVADPEVRVLHLGQYCLGGLLLLALGFSATASFRQERETGAIELLVVAPLRVSQIIGGRIRGLWAQFLPSLGLLIAIGIFLWIQFAGFLRHDPAGVRLTFLVFLMTSYLTVPVVGLFFSMRKLNFLVGWLLTCFIGLLLPMIFSGVLARLTPPPIPTLTPLLCQALVAVLAWLALNRELTQRQFVLVRA
jgi:ABC-type transport system involved in multi-copper enzyme maturation permease subunit